MKLKLFVWGNDSEAAAIDGILFALSSSVEEARNLIMEAEGIGTFERPDHKGAVYAELCREPKVFDAPTGYAVWGAG